MKLSKPTKIAIPIAVIILSIVLAVFIRYMRATNYLQSDLFEVDVTHMDIRPINPHTTQFVVSLELSSGLPVGMMIDRIDHEIYMGDVLVSKGENSIEPNKNDEACVSLKLPLNIDYSKLSKEGQKSDDSDSIQMQATLSVHVVKILGKSFEVPVDISYKISLPQQPQVTFEGMSFDGFKFRDPDLEITLKIYNPNNVNLKVVNAKVDVDFPELFKLTSDKIDTIFILAKETITTTLSASTEDFRLVKDVFGFLIKEEKRAYVMEGNMLLIFGDNKEMVDAHIYREDVAPIRQNK